MKKIIQICVSVLGVFVLALVAALAINATDEKQTELTRQMLQKFPAQEGFSFKDLRTASAERSPTFQFEKYSDYLQSPEKYDELILKYQKTIDVLGQALKTGRVELNPNASFLDGAYFYAPNDHRLFLMMLSQKIKQGQLKEALALLEDSNRFLTNVVATPQTFISGLIALAVLRANVDFLKSLKDEGVLKTVPSSVKESFRLATTPEKIWEQNSRREFQFISHLVLNPMDADMLGMTTVEAKHLGETAQSMANTLSGWLFPKLIRPNQTLNQISQGFAGVSSESCKEPTALECLKIYEDITQTTPANFLVNPVGRRFNKILFHRANAQIRVKIFSATERLQEAVEEI